MSKKDLTIATLNDEIKTLNEALHGQLEETRRILEQSHRTKANNDRVVRDLKEQLMVETAQRHDAMFDMEKRWAEACQTNQSIQAELDAANEARAKSAKIGHILWRNLLAINSTLGFLTDTALCRDPKFEKQRLFAAEALATLAGMKQAYNDLGEVAESRSQEIEMLVTENQNLKAHESFENWKRDIELAVSVPREPAFRVVRKLTSYGSYEYVVERCVKSLFWYRWVFVAQVMDKSAAEKIARNLAKINKDPDVIKEY
jgi:hypothetical protein